MTNTTCRTERFAPGVFAAALGATLAVWAWMTIRDGMGHHVEWWPALLLASALAGAAFVLDARSTARFGRRMIIKCEGSPLLRALARRYTLRSSLIVQAMVEAGLVASTPWSIHTLPAHHMVVGLLVLVAVAHCYGWRRNSRLWAEIGPE